MTALCVAQFVKVLNSIDGSKRRGEVFSDFCELAYCALAKVAAPTVDDRDKLECQYMEVVARYQNKDDIRKMPELLAISYDAINAGGIDFLGSVAGELGTLDAKLGQFFTPYAVSRMMAEIILQGAGEVIDKKGFITIQEPAVGAGGMLLAAADVIEEMGFPRASCVETHYLSKSIPVLTLPLRPSLSTTTAFLSTKSPKALLKPLIADKTSQLSLFDL